MIDSVQNEPPTIERTAGDDFSMYDAMALDFAP